MNTPPAMNEEKKPSSSEHTLKIMSYAELTNEELVALVQKRDEQAFTCLFKRNVKLAISKAVLKLNDYQEAEDVVLKVFRQLWDKPESLDFSNGHKFLGWLTIVVSRRAIDHMRIRLANQSKLDKYELTFVEENQDSQECVRDFVAIGKRIIEKLPNLQRKTMELTFDGFTEREIARKLGKSRSTIHQAATGAQKNFKRLTADAFS